jgi:glutathione synthase/RimK-type ligase-like ATP-grasp enzyme
MNFQTKGGALRVAKARLKNGELSFTISLVRNQRINGNPSHRRLAKIGTYYQSELSARAAEIYRILDRQVAKLTAEGVLWANDSSFIENQINKLVARPIPVITKPPASDHELLRNMIKEVAEKAEKRLKAERV